MSPPKEQLVFEVLPEAVEKILGKPNRASTRQALDMSRTSHSSKQIINSRFEQWNQLRLFRLGEEF